MIFLGICCSWAFPFLSQTDTTIKDDQYQFFQRKNMNFLQLLAFSFFNILFPRILAQGTFENVTVTTSIQVSNLPPSEGELNATASQGVITSSSQLFIFISAYFLFSQEISGIIYYNNCDFTSTLFGSFVYPSGTVDTIPLTSNLKANNSEWVKFNSFQAPDNSTVRIYTISLQSRLL